MNRLELDKILEQHKLWLDSGRKEGKRADLEGANLIGAYLIGSNLEGADLEGSNLKGVNLMGANLEGANLGSANLRDADLGGADLKGAYLERTNLRGANLEGANLEGAYLKDANLEGAYLREIKNKFIFTFQIGQHFAYYCDEYVSIGCKCLSLRAWQKRYKEIGERSGYSEVDIENYGFILTVVIPQLLENKNETV